MLNFIKENLFLFFILFLLVVAPSFLFGAAKILAYIGLALFVLAVIGSLVIKWKVRKFVREGGFAQQQYQQQQQRTSNSDDPKVKVYASSTEKKVAPDVGDYVEFEEVDDDNKR